MTAARATLLAVAAAALAACGDTLVDHDAPQIQQGPGSSVCPADAPVACVIAGKEVCKQESVQYCGSGCTDCRSTSVPANAVPACLGPVRGAGLCDYECTGGLLKCTQNGADACCQAKQVVASARHTCALTGDGAVYCWGDDTNGQVNQTPSATPITIPYKVMASGATVLAAGEEHSCAATATDVYCWGRNAEGQAPASAGVAGATALAAGLHHTCALVGTAVECWGTGPGAGNASPVVTGVNSLLERPISAGTDHTCALLATGGVSCWGANAQGQLGNGTQTDSLAPVTPIATGMSAVVAAGSHACATASIPSSPGGNLSNAVQCWGDEPGSLFGPTSPWLAPLDPRKDSTTSTVHFTVAAISTGATHTCVQKNGDGIQCFGPQNGAGQLGNATNPPTSEIGAVISGTVGAQHFAAGGNHACAILANGSVWCWGSNASGELGDGSTITPGAGGDPRPLGTLVPISGR